MQVGGLNTISHRLASPSASRKRKQYLPGGDQRTEYSLRPSKAKQFDRTSDSQKKLCLLGPRLAGRDSILTGLWSAKWSEHNNVFPTADRPLNIFTSDATRPILPIPLHRSQSRVKASTPSHRSLQPRSCVTARRRRAGKRARNFPGSLGAAFYVPRSSRRNALSVTKRNSVESVTPLMTENAI